MNLLIIGTVKGEKGVEKVREFLNYPSLNDALAALYNKMWYYASNEKTVNVVATIVNDNLNEVKRESYVRVVPATESAPVEEGSLG